MNPNFHARGNTRWAPNNLDALCGDAPDAEPARCFHRVMTGGINWGGGTSWQWENALALCKRSRDAARTVSCFQGQVASLGWQRAIANCQAR